MLAKVSIGVMKHHAEKQAGEEKVDLDSDLAFFGEPYPPNALP